MDPTKREHNVDQWLESALKQYGQAEPRTGLEGRVLANLHVVRNRSASRWRWWSAAGAVAAAAAIAAVLWVGENGRKKNAGGVAETSTTHHEYVRSSIEPGQVPRIVHTAGDTLARQMASRKPPQRQPGRELAAAATPRLEQFPSPRPLSEQEQILMSYVAQYPEKAALVAQAQAEALERDREEEAAAAAKDTAD